MDEFEIIPSRQWQPFCDRFSRTHRAWLIRLWVIDTHKLEAGLEDDSHMAIRDLQLGEITLEQHGERTDMAVMVREDGTHTSHLVKAIESMSVETDADGNESGLRVDNAAGRTTLMRFRTSTDPASLDGLAQAERH